jgi:hypothetical protein
MYNVSLSFATSLDPSDDQPGPNLGVLVTDATTGAPVTGLIQSQFAIYSWKFNQGYKAVVIDYFQELAQLQDVLLPGVYLIGFNLPTPTAGSIPFAVAVTTIPPDILLLRSGALPVPAPGPTVLGVGIGTYVSLSGLD